MTADQTVDRAADKLQELANQLAGEGGLKAKLSEPLAGDADLIRKMKPSLIKARARGEAPTNQKPGKPRVAPSSPDGCWHWPTTWNPSKRLPAPSAAWARPFRGCSPW